MAKCCCDPRDIVLFVWVRVKKEINKRQVFLTDPAWKSVRVFAVHEIKEREDSLLMWETALSEINNQILPVERFDDVWIIVATADYPFGAGNYAAQVVDLVIREDGEVLYYKNRTDDIPKLEYEPGDEASLESFLSFIVFILELSK